MSHDGIFINISTFVSVTEKFKISKNIRRRGCTVFLGIIIMDRTNLQPRPYVVMTAVKTAMNYGTIRVH